MNYSIIQPNGICTIVNASMIEVKTAGGNYINGIFILDEALPQVAAALAPGAPGIFNWVSPSYQMPPTLSTVVVRAELWTTSARMPPFTLVITDTKYKTVP